MQIIVVIFLFFTVLWLTYWALVRPIVLDSVQDEYRRMRAALDWSIIEGLPNAQSLPAKELEKVLADSDSIRWISLSQAFVAAILKRQEVKALELKEREVFESSPTWIRDMRERDIELTVKAALANSPSWWIPISVLLVAAIFSKQVANRWAEMKIAAKELRIEKLPATA